MDAPFLLDEDTEFEPARPPQALIDDYGTAVPAGVTLLQGAVVRQGDSADTENFLHSGILRANGIPNAHRFISIVLPKTTILVDSTGASDGEFPGPNAVTRSRRHRWPTVGNVAIPG